MGKNGSGKSTFAKVSTAFWSASDFEFCSFRRYSERLCFLPKDSLVVKL